MKVKINIFSENICTGLELDERGLIEFCRKTLQFFLDSPEVFKKSCLFGEKFKTISFDILYCTSEKTHEINREYRKKDYAADVITFAIFADAAPAERFVFDNEINLGEIIIAPDKAADCELPVCAQGADPLKFLLAHGIMHLLGFEHDDEESYDFVVRMQNEALKA